MHFSESLEYQFAATPSREMIRDFVSIASSTPAEAMLAL
jgi:hypothetical protein